MKRVAILAAVLLSGAAFAAEQWNAEQIAQKKAEAAAAKSAWQRASINAELAVKGGTAPGSYAEIEQRCIAAYGAEKYLCRLWKSESMSACLFRISGVHCRCLQGGENPEKCLLVEIRSEQEYAACLE